MSQRRHHLHRSPFQRLLRGHPVFSVFAAVIALIGAATVVTGAVGGLAAGRSVITGCGRAPWRAGSALFPVEVG
jgi:hypothetical protein